jgi:hypothetical protein
MTNCSDEYLTEISLECRGRLIRTFSEEITEFMYLLSKMRGTLQAFSAESAEQERMSARGFAHNLMHRGANTLMASFELALSGYQIEPPILFRNAIEVCALAWDIVGDKKIFASFQKDKKFHSADSINRIRKVNKFYAKLWDNLSQASVHISKKNHCPVMFRGAAGPLIPPYGFIPVGKEETSRYVVEFALMVAHACLHLAEVVFYPFISDPETTVETGVGLLSLSITERHQRFVASFEQTDLRLRSDPGFGR